MGQMREGIRLLLMLAAAVAFAILSPVASRAETFPARPLRMIVAYQAGGPSDALARILAEGMSAELGQQVVIENRGGAGGVVGYGAAAASDPDGYTLAFVENSITVNPSLHKNLRYDFERDLVPIGLAVRGPTVLVARKSFEAKLPKDLVALAKRERGRLTYGSAGSGTPPHLNAELFRVTQGIELKHVPYRGAAPAITDLLADRIDLMFLNIGSVKTYLDAGTMLAIAVSGPERAAQLPDVPTWREAGVPVEQLDSGTWWGLMVPSATPPEVRRRLSEALNAALRRADLVSRLEAMNVSASPGAPEEFGRLLSSERAKWADVVARAGIKAD